MEEYRNDCSISFTEIGDDEYRATVGEWTLTVEHSVDAIDPWALTIHHSETQEREQWYFWYFDDLDTARNSAAGCLMHSVFEYAYQAGYKSGEDDSTNSGMEYERGFEEGCRVSNKL